MLQMEPEKYLQPYSGRIKLLRTSYLGVQPGDLIFFNYSDGSKRFGLVVSSSRTSSGIFLSTRNNTLMNVFQIEGLSDAMFDIVVNNLYKNVEVCSYYNKRMLRVFFKEDFRTFNVAEMSNITSIGIK